MPTLAVAPVSPPARAPAPPAALPNTDGPADTHSFEGPIVVEIAMSPDSASPPSPLFHASGSNPNATPPTQEPLSAHPPTKKKYRQSIFTEHLGSEIILNGVVTPPATDPLAHDDLAQLMRYRRADGQLASREIPRYVSPATTLISSSAPSSSGRGIQGRRSIDQTARGSADAYHLISETPTSILNSSSASASASGSGSGSAPQQSLHITLPRRQLDLLHASTSSLRSLTMILRFRGREEVSLHARFCDSGDEEEEDEE